MKKHISIAKPGGHGHMMLVYSKQEERLRVLAEYFAEGLANGELCVLVVPEPIETIIEALIAAGLANARQAVTDNKLRIFETDKTYLPHGAFVSNYMVTNVVNYMIDAKARGFTGVRTAGEMAWLYEHPEFLDDAMQYEDQISELSTRNPDLIGLCLYPVRDDAPAVLEGAARTHPNVYPTA